MTAAQDVGTLPHSLNQHCSPDGYVPGLAIPSVSVTVDDNETPGVAIDMDPSTQHGRGRLADLH